MSPTSIGGGYHLIFPVGEKSPPENVEWRAKPLLNIDYMTEDFMEQNPSNQQRQKQSIQNSNTRTGNNRPLERNKRYSQGRNSNTEDNHNLKVQQGNRERPLGQDRMKGREGMKYGTKGKDQRLTEKISPDVKSVKSNQNKSYKSNSGVSSRGNPRYGRNASRNSGHNEILGRSIKTKRIETVEDIQADIERIDKDIQFEIKQIKAVKLGI